MKVVNCPIFPLQKCALGFWWGLGKIWVSVRFFCWVGFALEFFLLKYPLLVVLFSLALCTLSQSGKNLAPLCVEDKKYSSSEM